MWLNDANSHGDEINEIKQQLRQVINYVQIFTDVDECVDYITSIENEKIYFVIAGSLAKTIIPFIHEIANIQSIYIHDLNADYSTTWAQRHQKVRSISCDMPSICNALRQNVLGSRGAHVRYSSPLIFETLPSSENSRSREQEVIFMYFRLLIKLIVRISRHLSLEDDFSLFLKLCRRHYTDNRTESERIVEFHHTYSSTAAVH